MRRLASTNRLLWLGASAGAVPLRGSGCRNLALPGVYEQNVTFPDSYLISFLLNLMYTTILNWVRPYPHAQSSSSGTQQDHMKKCQIALNLRTGVDSRSQVVLPLSALSWRNGESKSVVSHSLTACGKETLMPQKMWKHTCPEDGSAFWMGTPFCSRCGGPGGYDGWHYRMHEAMARYQSLYGLKPIGPHRRMADELFNDVKVKCEACGGRGPRDVNGGASWEHCGVCRGLGILFTGPATEIAEIRSRVLDAFPDAAADPVPEFATAPLAYDLSQGEIVDLSTESAKRGAKADEKDQ